MGLQEIVWCNVDPETQVGSLALRHFRQAISNLCILGIVDCLSDGRFQDETKQDPEISMLRDNRGYAYNFHQC